MEKKPIFINKGLLSFAWAGGRLLIMYKEKLIDFGDGGMSRGKRGVGNYEYDDDRFGWLHASDTKFNFRNLDIQFDFDDLQNCHFLNKNKNISGEWALLYHFNRFHKKHKHGEKRSTKDSCTSY